MGDAKEVDDTAFLAKFGEAAFGRLVASHPDVPVIFMTAHDDARARSQALSCGAAAYLIKPFSEDALLDAVRAALGPT